MIAKVGKSYTIAERLVKPAMLICAKELLREQAANILQKIPLSNDTVKRRQDEMAENLEEQLVEKLKVSKFSLLWCNHFFEVIIYLSGIETCLLLLLLLTFSLQIDETTINNSILLLTYVQYIDAMEIHEESVFINKLIDTRSETLQLFITSCTIMGFLCQIYCRQTVPVLWPESTMVLLQN